ncbi:MAG TPA: tetratricopeptide repeat protein [Burkholderiaceae bacterium]|nr:tetratricopeptide repeat protein [Burkholderiaceae bacterium]
MQLDYQVPTPLEYFKLLVSDDSSSDGHFPLLEAATALAQDEYPDLDVQAVLDDVDKLLARVKRRIPADSSALQRLRILSQFFFRDLGFGGNVNHFYDAENSFINSVLRTRRGIPISLAVLWLELAQGLKLDAHGVAFPGHFMLKVSLPNGQVVIDPFTGQSLSREDLNERLQPFQNEQNAAQKMQELDDELDSSKTDQDIPLGLYLQAAKPRDIVVRMLHNLKEIYRSQEDWQRMIQVQDRLIALYADAWEEYRDRGLAFAELGKATAAVQDFDTYLQHVMDAPDVNAIALRAQELRRALI